MRMPSLVAAVRPGPAGLGAARARARRSWWRSRAGADSVALARRARARSAPPRLPAGGRAPRPRAAAGSPPTTRPSAPSLLRLARRPASAAGRRRRARARRARAGRARAGGAPRALRVPAAREARGGRRLRSPSPTPATTRPRRCCCACCAAPGATGLAGMRPRSGDLRRGRCSACPRARGARAPARARARLARGSHERRPRAPRATACATSCCRTSSTLQPAPARGARAHGGAPGRRGRATSRRKPRRSSRASAREEGAALVLDRRGSPSAPGRSLGRAVRLALPRTGGLRGVAALHVERVLQLARSEAPAGRRLPFPGGREARFTHRTPAARKACLCRPTKAVSSSPDQAMRDKISVLFTEEQIARRVAELGGEIAKAFAGREICVVGLMKGCLVFMADLIRSIPLDMTVHLVRVTSQRERGARARVHTEIVYSTAVPLRGARHPAAGRHRGHRASRSTSCSTTSASTARAACGCAALDRQARGAQDRRPSRLGRLHRCTSRSPTASWSATGWTGGALPGAALHRDDPPPRARTAAPGVS